MALKNDNTLRLSLGLDQDAPNQKLSRYNTTLEYPEIDRDAANLLQLDLVISQTLGIYKFAALQAVAEGDAEKIEMYVSNLTATAAQIANLQEVIVGAATTVGEKRAEAQQAPPAASEAYAR